jgi:capsular exopolysaccharide synthesis family protein
MADPNRQKSRSEGVGPKVQRTLQLFLKRKWLILMVLLIAIGGVALWTLSRTRIYRSTATVLVDFQAPQVLGSKVREVVDLNVGRWWRTQRYMETQRRVIASKTLAVIVASRLGLANNAEFWGEAAPTEPSVDAAASRLMALVSAVPSKGANILEISAEHPKPEMAKILANALAQAYMDHNIRHKMTSAEGAVKWLADQLDTLKKELETAEMALYTFKKTNNIISVSIKDKQSLIARQIWKLNDGLTEIRMKRIALLARRKQARAALRDQPQLVPLDTVQSSALVQALRTVFVEERRKYLVLKQRYLEKHPLVVGQKAKVGAARSDLKEEIQNILATVESRYRELHDTERSMAGALQGAKNEGLDINRREVAYRRLERQQKNTEELYGLVLSRMKESDLSSQIKSNNIRWLDQATASIIPIRPRIQLNLAIGALLGLLFGIGLVFLVELMDASIKTQEDIGFVPNLVFLGLMPHIPGTPATRGRRSPPNPDADLIVHRNPKSAVAESCRAIRTNLLFASPDQTMKRIVVTSAGPTEGKTTTGVSIAVAMAQAGNRVVIVDTDMRRPRLHRIFGVPGTEGITSVLLGDVQLDDVIKSTEVPGLYVLPCGPAPPNPAELCQSEKFKTVLAGLSERFDRVVMDSPPVMVVTDAVLLSTIADGTLLVARTGRTSRTALRDATAQLQDVGANVVGCVLNDMDLERRGYGYYRYRRYGYGGRYGYYRYGHYGDNEKEAASSR